jgi:SAM-dependent methyltransferase
VFLSLGDLPLTDAYVEPDRAGAPEPRYPLDVALCGECSLVQILHTVPPQDIFQDYSYYSSVSRTLLDHSRDHANELIRTRGLGPASLVVEVASNDGYLLRNFVERGIPVLGIDPARGPAEVAAAAGVPTLQAFFGGALAAGLRAEGRTADVLLANNVLAHVADLNGVVEGIATILAADGLAEIEVPSVGELLANLEFDTIYHEHLCYFSVTALDALFRRHGLWLNRVRPLPIHGGSIRLSVGRAPDPDGSVERHLRAEEEAGLRELETYRRFADRVRELQGSLRSLLERLRDEGRRVAAYGAAAKGTVLLNACGIGRDLVAFVADKSPHKQGKLVPGVHVPIVSPRRIRAEMPDRVLLLAWNVRDEVLQEHREYLAAGGRFIVPIPAPVEIGEEAVATAVAGPRDA